MAGSVKKSSPPVNKQRTLLSFFQKRSSPPKVPTNGTMKPEFSQTLPNSESNIKLEPLPSSPLRPTSSPLTPNKTPNSSASHQSSEPSSSTGKTDELGELSLNTPDQARKLLPSSSPVKRIGRRAKRKMIIDSDSEDDAALEDDDESEDDWKPDAAVEEGNGDDEMEDNTLFVEKEEDKMDGNSASDADKTLNSEFDSMYIQSPSLRRNSSLNTTKSSSSPVDPTKILSKFSKDSDYTTAITQQASTSHLPRTKKVRVSEDPERYKWLLNIKDADGNSPDEPNYDPRTLLVPNSAWAKFTPFEKQYWEVKQNLWNTVVFFKKGKFYELYENDAEIAHRLFDLKLAGGGRANMSLCGVPEMSFDYWASAFIAKGYKVARVDQAETALGKEMRDIANKKKEEKIIRRELSCVLTGGTLTDATMLVSDLSQYCMAIKQDGLDFAACFVDTATSQFYISRFTDKSSDYPILESLLAQIRPKELVIARGNLEKYALKIIKNNTSVDTLWEIVKPDTEFWDADSARLRINLEDYFEDPKAVPAALAERLSNCDLSASAIGGLVWYLRTLKLDQQLLSLGQFSEYNASVSSHGKTMVIDGQTLQNLEVFANSWDGGSEGTLFKLVNRCVTPFGKRRLRSWIVHPLQDPSDIACRANMVDMFMEQDEVSSVLSDRLVGLPDTERMLSRVHAGTLKPKDFVTLVGGLESMANLLKWLNGLKAQLPQLAPFVSSDATPAVTKLEAAIEPWLTAFDHMEAKTNGKLIPEKGVDEEFDITMKAVTETEIELKDLLKQYRKDFKSMSLEYRDSGKEIYLIEVPMKLVKQVPHDWQQMGATSKFKRYWSPDVKRLVRTLQEAQELHNLSAQACQQKLYRKFCSTENYQIFMDATKVVSAIDCLLSLAKTSQGMAMHCRPEILETSVQTIEFTELRHPVATTTDFIPNDVHLGGYVPRFSLLTGANAAGKSTVLRTTCCAILLAQLGCHVPAQTARLTPVDRIMTRLGASDNIFAGKSTFHVELAETERILSEASSRSFVVLDELGRGGSSSDGFAIAEAVLHHLATHVACIGFFATHYATLYDSFTDHIQVKPERMAIDVDTGTREVTFLYKLESGRSEGSFGMNVASMCGVSPHIVEAAEKAAKMYEHTSMLQRSNKCTSIVPLGLESDIFWAAREGQVSKEALEVMLALAGK